MITPHPVVTVCRTCEGSGDIGQNFDDVHPQYGLDHSQPCPDCTEGWVTNLGTIEHRCNVHGLKQDVVSVRLGLTPICHANGLTPADTCVFGLVLVIAIGDDDED